MNKLAESGFDAATRIAAGGEGRNYDNVAVALHWLTALLVVVQFAFAVSWDYFDKATRQIWFGTDQGAIGSVTVPPRALVP